MSGNVTRAENARRTKTRVINLKNKIPGALGITFLRAEVPQNNGGFSFFWRVLYKNANHPNEQAFIIDSGKRIPLHLSIPGEGVIHEWGEELVRGAVHQICEFVGKKLY